MPIRDGAGAAAFALILVLQACDRSGVAVFEGQPAGPHRLTLTLSPAAPQPEAPALLTYHLTHAATHQPIHDLQILHERLIHTFIVARDFSSFAHIHHEDFAPVLPADLAAATLHFPYAFPHPGAYRIVSEFTRRDRSWIKQFDVTIGAPVAAAPPVLEIRDAHSDPYRGALDLSPATPVAGFESELVLNLSRDGAAVSDLALLLGAEVHVALWRSDGELFGHTHSFTPEMAAMSRHGPHSAVMMLQMMMAPAKLIYPGPQVPVHYTFPEPGVYHVFMQCAPGGESRVFHFVINVVPNAAGMDTTLHSMVPAG